MIETTYYGKPLSSYSKEELIGIKDTLARREKEFFEEKHRQMNVLLGEKRKERQSVWSDIVKSLTKGGRV